MQPSPLLIVFAVLAGLLLVGALAYTVVRDRRFAASHRGELRDLFGSEYTALSRERGERRATRELDQRVERVRRLHIEPLSARERERFSEAWEETLRRFVDDPKGAVREADQLVQEVMQARGYPVADFDQRVRDVSVHHPNVVASYRSARAIAGRVERGEATTEDMRGAVLHYSALFVELVEDRGGPHDPGPFKREGYS